MSSSKLKTNGNWLTWARKMSDYKIDAIAKKMKVDLNTVSQWEKTGDIDYDNLIKLSNHYNRSPMLFFNINNPDLKEQTTPDFRTKGDKKEKLSFDIIKVLQNANNKRENLISLEEELDDYEFPIFQLNSSTENVNKLAEYVRKIIGMKKSQIDVIKSQEKALDHWIGKIEKLGVLIFQFYDVKISEMRGYALYHEKLPIIGINNKEHPNGKKFTLFHELVHLIIRKEGISNLNKFDIENKTEIFCNAVAGEILIPQKIFETKLNDDYDNVNKWNDKQIYELSKYFKVSNEVILRKLLISKKISSKYYNLKKKEWEEMYIAIQTKKQYEKKKNHEKSKQIQNELKHDHYIRQATQALRKNGNLYTNLVLEAYDSKLITNKTLSDYLEVNLQIIGEIRNKLKSGDIE
ncbi:MAG: XRE family transcriptional regulator [Methanobrevibacter sp.]|jgi:Zn-dependent peptidase ImmA (M78 family)|nr:XRE family transcriptional regulator [Candidatus Methanovirga meridionalis]